MAKSETVPVAVVPSPEVLATIERAACQCDDVWDWCAVCSRSTCHFGEHSDEQLVEFGKKRGLL